MPKSPYAFISYRREDADAAARSLRDALEDAFGADHAFMDTRSIGPGDTWGGELERGVGDAAVVLAVMGRWWLRSSDDFGRRRIDLPDDWVRREIELAIEKRVMIIPLLVGRTALPPREALPASISSLLDFNAIELRENRWREDLVPLVQRLEKLDFPRRELGYDLPRPKKTRRYPPPLRGVDLATELLRIPDWEETTSALPGQAPAVRRELHRSYTFKRFEDAMRFMWLAADEVSRVQHHPRWENVWKTVTVWLSTWDLEHVITELDIDLAETFDRIASEVTEGIGQA